MHASARQILDYMGQIFSKVAHFIVLLVPEFLWARSSLSLLRFERDIKTENEKKKKNQTENCRQPIFSVPLPHRRLAPISIAAEPKPSASFVI